MGFLAATAALARPLTARSRAVAVLDSHPSGLLHPRAIRAAGHSRGKQHRITFAPDTHLKPHSEIVFLAYASWLR